MYDMAGNVWEWCADLWEKGVALRVIRGGSWHFVAWDCRAANRDGVGPQFRDDVLGFRVARGPSG